MQNVRIAITDSRADRISVNNRVERRSYSFPIRHTESKMSRHSHPGYVDLINYSAIRCLRQFRRGGGWIAAFIVIDNSGIAFRLFKKPGHSSDPDRLAIQIVPMAADANYSLVPIYRILGRIIDVSLPKRKRIEPPPPPLVDRGRNFRSILCDRFQGWEGVVSHDERLL